MDAERYDEAIRLLEATHAFPCPFLIKVIGRAEDAFLSRIVAALRGTAARAGSALPHPPDTSGAAHCGDVRTDGGICR